jgi:uncharacterized protein (TIGR03083 family)
VFTTMPARAGEIVRPTELHALGMVRGELSRTQALLGDLDPAEWLRATDCAGWSVRDVVAHMIGENEELCRPTLLVRRIHAARRLAGPDGDGRSKGQIRDRAGRSTEQLMAELACWGRKATLAAERIPGPLRRMRGSIFFPAARGAPGNTIDYFIRVLMPREAWMHRTDIVIAARRPAGMGAQDGEVVRQVIRDLALAWSGPAVILDFSGPMGGRWSVGAGRPVAEVHSDPVSFARLAAGRPGCQPVIDGDGATAAELLATRVVSCPPPRGASPA